MRLRAPGAPRRAALVRLSRRGSGRGSSCGDGAGHYRINEELQRRADTNAKAAVAGSAQHAVRRCRRVTENANEGAGRGSARAKALRVPGYLLVCSFPREATLRNRRARAGRSARRRRLAIAAHGRNARAEVSRNRRPHTAPTRRSSPPSATIRLSAARARTTIRPRAGRSHPRRRQSGSACRLDMWRPTRSCPPAMNVIGAGSRAPAVTAPGEPPRCAGCGTFTPTPREVEWKQRGLSDHDRPLTRRGRGAATAIARHLREQGIGPELVLCSTARRARETLERIEPVLARRTAQEESELTVRARARCSSGCVWYRTRSARLLIGHNPGLQQLALVLPQQTPELRELEAKYPTAALAILAFDRPNWSELDRGTTELVSFVRPRDLGD